MSQTVPHKFWIIHKDRHGNQIEILEYFKKILEEKKCEEICVFGVITMTSGETNLDGNTILDIISSTPEVVEGTCFRVDGSENFGTSTDDEDDDDGKITKTIIWEPFSPQSESESGDDSNSAIILIEFHCGDLEDEAVKIMGVALSTCTHVLFCVPNAMENNELVSLDKAQKFKGELLQDSSLRPVRLFLLFQHCKERPYSTDGGEEKLLQQLSEVSKDSNFNRSILHKNNFSKWEAFRQQSNNTKNLKQWLPRLLDVHNLSDRISTTDGIKLLQEGFSAYISAFIDAQEDFVDFGEEANEDMASLPPPHDDLAIEFAEVVSDYPLDIQEKMNHHIDHCYSQYILLMEDHLSNSANLQQHHISMMNVVLQNFRAKCEADIGEHVIDISTSSRLLEGYIECHMKAYTPTKCASLKKKRFMKGIRALSKARIAVSTTKYHNWTIPNTEMEFVKFYNNMVADRGQDYVDNHPAIFSALAAKEAGVSMNTAHILLLGNTGQGKSTTINFLFGKQCCPEGLDKSITDEVTEFYSEIRKSRLFMGNLKLAFIDGPGFADTTGCTQLNIAIHRQFFETHPQLRYGLRPNIVMIVHNINDTRIGKLPNDTDTPFISMLKKIKGGLHSRICNSVKPNYIFVLTHLEKDFNTQEAIKANADRMTTTVKQLAGHFLGLDDPPVICVENKPTRKETVYKDSYGWYHLSNGDKHPLSLFSKLIEICEKNSDPIGKEAISLFFSQKASVAAGFKVSRKNVPQQHVGDEPPQKIDILLRHHFSQLTLTEKEGLGENIYESITTYLRNKGFEKCSDLEGEDILEILQNYPNQPQGLTQYVALALGMPLYRTNMDVLVGYGYNVLRDEPTGHAVYKVGDMEYRKGCTIRIPEYVEVYNDPNTFKRSEFLHSIEEYGRQRLQDLNVTFAFPIKLIGIKVHSGYSLKNAAGNRIENTQRSMLYEHTLFKLRLSDGAPFSEVFVKEVNSLPQYFDPEDSSVWNNFFAKYGTHVVKVAWAGGSCAVTVQSTTSTMTDDQMNQVLAGIEGQINGVLCRFLKSVGGDASGRNLNTDHAAAWRQEVRYTIHMRGGDPNLHCSSLEQMTWNDTQVWLRSLNLQPTMLTSNLRLDPISSAAGTIRPQVAKEIEKALRYFHGEKENANALQALVPVGTIRPEMNARSRKDATEMTAPKFWKKPTVRVTAGGLVGGVLVGVGVAVLAPPTLLVLGAAVGVGAVVGGGVGYGSGRCSIA